MSPAHPAWRLSALLLLVLACARVASLVFAEPVAGYANQYDMHRSSACIGLWPDAVPIAQATPDAPRAVYRIQPAQPAQCYPSTQVAIGWLALVADRALDGLRGSDTDRMSLRAIGAIGLVGWALGTLLMAWMLWAQPRALFGHGLASALLIADPFNTLYLNTLYTEFPALCALYFGGGVVLSLWLDANAPARRLWALALCLVLLGLARVQHLLLPAVLAVFALMALWRAGAALLRPALLLAFCCVLVVGVQALQQQRFATIARANVADTVLGAALPAGDPETIAQSLGLDARCADLAYSTWYRQHGVDVFAECPALAQVSRLRLLAVTLREPSVIARMLLRGVLMSQNLRLGYLGERGGAAFAVVGAADSPLWVSIADLVNALPALLFLWLALALLGTVPMFWLTLIAQRRAAMISMGADSLLMVICAHVLAIALLSSVFGDGYSEVARHLHLGLNALLIAVCLLPVWLLQRWPLALVRASWRSVPMLPALLLLAWLGVVAYVLLRLPLAFGVLSTPSGVVPRSGSIELRGWALDARPIQRLSARVDGRALVALAPVHHPGLDRVFPYLATADQEGFVATIDAAMLTGGRFLEIVAIDAAGREVLIERRRLR